MSDERDSRAPEPDSASPRPEPWPRVRTEQVADCRVFRVRRDWSLDPRTGGAREHDFYVVEAPAWINVIPMTPDGRVVLVEQYRHGTRAMSLEIPGGMVDEGESPDEAAGRELLEETGYAARELVPLGRTRPNPALQNNWLHTFLARDVSFRGKPPVGGTEQTAVRLVPLAEVARLAASGAIDHSLVVVAFYLLALYTGGRAAV